MKRLLATIAGASVLPLVLLAQSSVDSKSVMFDVASVRANRSGVLAGFRGIRGRTYVATNQPLLSLIAQAYGVPVVRVLGGPVWIGAASADARFIGGDRFDITATLPEGAAAPQVAVMLRGLLAERFKLVVHAETRETPIYALVVARGDKRLGPQLRKGSLDCEAAEAAGEAIPAPKSGEPVQCAREVGGAIMGRGQRLDSLARVLSMFVDRPVVDRSGLIGGFDFDLQFPELRTPVEDRGGGLATDGGGIFVAVQEQLGLKLEPTTGPVEFVVIDSVEHPSEN
jgi:uncharacterized protein (TIGR03435 family)